jgi:bifunctional non-homologous end joining protein LigD
VEGHAEWIFELKYDGFRALAFIDDGTCRLVSRNGNRFKSFSTLASQRDLLARAIGVRGFYSR